MEERKRDFSGYLTREEFYAFMGDFRTTIENRFTTLEVKMLGVNGNHSKKGGILADSEEKSALIRLLVGAVLALAGVGVGVGILKFL